MKRQEEAKLLESLFVEMDPLQDGFAGVLLEVYRRSDWFVLLETASPTGNRLPRLSSKDRGLVYAVLACELDDPLRWMCVSA